MTVGGECYGSRLIMEENGDEQLEWGTWSRICERVERGGVELKKNLRVVRLNRKFEQVFSELL